MNAGGPSTGSTTDARAETLAGAYERAGYARVAPAMLQPAEPFLDLSGEDIRKRMYLTTAPGGAEYCLRPDLTIPVARDYLASPLAEKPAGFCYLGPVFRHRADGPSEFLQLGIESFGREDRAAADAEMLALAQRMLTWRMAFNRRELTGIRVGRGAQTHAARTRRIA